jgi:glycine/D-amino acid oxidase-like deaminating enzyme
MQTQFLIVGQGLCGTWLSYYLQQAGASFIVIDVPCSFSASKVASGIINPVTGRRMVKTWMIDELLPFAKRAYENMGQLLQQEAIVPISTIDFFPTPQMQLAFEERYRNDGADYLSLPLTTQQWKQQFSFDFGAGIIEPCFLVQLHSLLPTWRKQLENRQQLLEAHFVIDELIINDDSIQYNDITAEVIIFCDGIAGSHHSYFKNLPFAATKGEMLLAEIPHLPPTAIYKKGMSLVPWQGNTWWIGSSFEWEIENDKPSEAFRNKATQLLKSWLKTSFTIVAHHASIRPGTLERRPFVGRHPHHRPVAIFNGMGTKGCSLAPYFAQQLTNYLLHNTPIMPEADVNRFSKVLLRNLSN